MKAFREISTTLSCDLTRWKSIFNWNRMKQDYDSYIANDRFARSLGIELTHVEDEQARCEMEVTENHHNGLGSLHGAVIFSLADVAFAAACNTVQPSIGLQAVIKYLKNPEGDRLIAEAKLVSNSNMIGNYQVSVSDGHGNLVAQFSSVSLRFPPNS